MRNGSPRLFGVIHIGSEQVSLQIVEYFSLEDMRVVERVCSQVSLGEETFKNGRIDFCAVKEICELLKGYRRILNEYGVKEYRLLATTAIREAENREYIVDQIRVKTGFTVDVVDMIQEIFHKYVTMFRAVEKRGLVLGAEGILFVDISSGGLGITLYEDEILKYQQNIHIGALRIKESFDKYQRQSLCFYQALTEFISSTIRPVGVELGGSRIKYMVLSGVETGMLLKMLGHEEAGNLKSIGVADFLNLHDRVKRLNIPQVMQEFKLSQHRAEMVLPTIVLYKQILDLANVEDIIVSNAQFSDGITICDIGARTNDSWLTTIDKQIVSLAHAIGRKYKYDQKHAANVEQTALVLFDRLIKVHGLSKRERFILQVAAILHDVGKFISLRRHYFYSYRIISSADILGFSEEEKVMMANIAFYHSKGTPSSNDPEFAVLAPEKQMTVAKLAAIIRLADAIDRSHFQKAIIRDVVLSGDELIICVSSEMDISLEEWTFFDKAEFFARVFGIKAVLRRN
ncbi:MAG: guanosine pentaphosphate phosphohydrolase [Firmicutes bacterium]|nr:guanosine pentaphosphate phosphohydrolase [Bacillota bacterium]